MLILLSYICTYIYVIHIPNRSPLRENWINLSLYLNFSAWSSQKPSSNFQNLLQPTSSQPSCVLYLYVLLRCSHICPSHITLTVSTSISPDSKPRPLIDSHEKSTYFKHFVIFWVFNWRLGWEMPRNLTQHTQPATTSHAIPPPLSSALLGCYSTIRKFFLFAPTLKAPVDLSICDKRIFTKFLIRE